MSQKERRRKGTEEDKRSSTEAQLIEFRAAWRGQGSADQQTPLEWRLWPNNGSLKQNASQPHTHSVRASVASEAVDSLSAVRCDSSKSRKRRGCLRCSKLGGQEKRRWFPRRACVTSILFIAFVFMKKANKVNCLFWLRRSFTRTLLKMWQLHFPFKSDSCVFLHHNLQYKHTVRASSAYTCIYYIYLTFVRWYGCIYLEVMYRRTSFGIISWCNNPYDQHDGNMSTKYIMTSMHSNGTRSLSPASKLCDMWAPPYLMGWR